MVPLTGLEPERYCYQRILSPQCLPFHHISVRVDYTTDVIKSQCRDWHRRGQSADCRTALLYLCCLICIVTEGFASAEATRGLSDRPLDPFGSPLPELTFSAAGGIAPVGAIEGCTHRFGSSVRISLIDMQYGSASWLRPCSRITCAVFCIAGKALRIRWFAWMTMFTPCAASSSSVVML